jgi:hypothetical protein
VQFKLDVDDKRSGIRLDFKLPVEVFCAGTGNRVHGIMVNLSVHGMLVEVPSDIIALPSTITGECKVKIVFPGKGSRLMIDQLRSSIVRVEDNMIAIKFNEPLEWFLLFNVYKGRQLHV